VKKILVPCDFSEPAQQAYKFALALATASGGEVWVMKAVDLPVMYESAFGVQPYVVDQRLLKELEDSAHTSFLRLKEMFPENAVPVTFKVEFGPVTHSIRQFIADKEIDLVVMGTHGAAGWKEYVIGSNTERIVRFSTVPVIAIRQAPEIEEVKNIVFATTLDLHQNQLVTRVKEMQDFFGATLHVLHINTPTNFKRGPETKVALEEYAKHYKLHQYTLQVRNDVYEMDGIISFAQEMEADLVAMATHGRRGLWHALAGSIAEDVVNHIDCPIWTYSLREK
jgi:nucleotide-binding universal stress UspA family protein